MKNFIILLGCIINVLTINAQGFKCSNSVNDFIYLELKNPGISDVELIKENKSDTINFDTDIIVQEGSNGLRKGNHNGKEVFYISAKGKITYLSGLFSNTLDDLTGLPNTRIDISAIKEGFHYADKTWFPTTSSGAYIFCIKNKILGYNVKF